MAFVTLVGCGGDSDNEDGKSPVPSAVVSGVISIEARTRIDSDTADDFQIGAAKSNDESPQVLPSPTLAGGYLSSGQGDYVVEETPGDEFYPFFTDKTDQFQLALTENQTVNVQAFPVVQAPSSPGNPLGTIELRSPDGSVIDDSPILKSGAATVAPLQGAATATYTLSLTTAQDSGPFRYVLSVTANNDSTTGNTFTYIQPDFMPDEAIVTMKPGTGGAKAMTSAFSAGEAESMGHGVWHLKRSRTVPLALMSKAQEKAAQKETLTWLRKLKASADVRTAEPNYRVHAFAVNASDDPLFRRQWSYPLISLPTAWQALNKPGQGVRVAVLDTGVFSTTPARGGNWHPDLDDGASNGSNIEIVTPIADFVSASQDNDANNGRDGNSADPGDGGSPQTTSFHGTHVAGTIAALNNTVGGVGVAPYATLLPIRVLGKGEEGTVTDLIDAVDMLAALSMEKRPDVINLSLGGLGPVEALKKAIQRAVDKNIIVVAAAGNRGASDKVYPAAFSNVVGVGAVDAGRRRASYSSFGSWLQLVAPGGDASRDGNNDGQADIIISPWGTIDNGTYVPVYAGLQGTSMAAPHVSGVIALMKERDRDLNLGKFLGFLRQGDLTDDVGSRNEYGFGLINAVKAVGAATSGSLGEFLVPSPGSFQFESPYTPANITLEAFPEGSTAIDSGSISVESKPSWLEVTLPPGKLTLNTKVKESEKDKAEQATVTINYTNSRGVQTLKIPVNVQSGDAPANRNAGRHFVLLVTTDESEATVAQLAVEPGNGQYRFAFDDIPNGDYFVVAGSDLDNNGYICEAGEACAEYPTNGFPQPITKGGAAIQGLQLTSSFQRPALGSQSLPRIGFKGYRLLDSDDNGRSTDNKKSVAP